MFSASVFDTTQPVWTPVRAREQELYSNVRVQENRCTETLFVRAVKPILARIRNVIRLRSPRLFIQARFLRSS